MAAQQKAKEAAVVVDAVDVVAGDGVDNAAGPPTVVESIFAREAKVATGASTFAERAKARRAAEKRSTSAEDAVKK